ncbi:MAG: hypothetical protein ACSLFE_02385 [Gemmatimonadaceae bacterium]
MAAAIFAFATPLGAQQPDSAGRTGADSTKPAAPAAPKLDLSGVVFANYQYRTNRGASRGANKFDLERVYLTLRMPAGERASVRITTDVFQQPQSGNDSYYRGWTIRAKYAYLQYDYLKRGTARGAARFGLVHNVFIEHDETYWPRWISTVATDRHGYFSSADAGLASAITLPRKLGEVYAAITNGPGYTSREVDRFKDYGARLTLTPFASRADGLLGSLALTAWSYQGSTASRFAAGGAGQLGPVGSSLQRDRWGVFAAVKNPALTIAAQYAARKDEGETGSNTIADQRAVVDSAGHLVSAYAIARPFASLAGAARSISLVGRVDRVTTNRALRQQHTLVIGGVAIDLTKAASLSLDYQEQLPRDGGPASPSKTVFLHLIARF